MADEEQQDMPPPRPGCCSCSRMTCSCGRMFDACLSPDIFAKTPQLRLPSGQKKYNTFFGCCFTLLYFAILGAFIFFVTMGLVEIDKNMMTRVTTRDLLEIPTATVLDVVGFKVIDPKDSSYKLDSAFVSLKAYLRSWDFVEEASNFTEKPTMTE